MLGLVAGHLQTVWAALFEVEVLQVPGQVLPVLEPGRVPGLIQPEVPAFLKGWTGVSALRSGRALRLFATRLKASGSPARARP